MKPLLAIAQASLRSSQASAFAALALLTLPTMALADNFDDGKPRNSYERQQENYRQHGYDTRQNGPLDETVLEEARRQEQRQREAERQEQERQQSRERNQHRSGY